MRTSLFLREPAGKQDHRLSRRVLVGRKKLRVHSDVMHNDAFFGKSPGGHLFSKKLRDRDVERGLLVQDVPLPDIHSGSIMRAEKISIGDGGIVAVNGDDQRNPEPAGQRKSGKPGRGEVSMNQDGPVPLDAPEEKGCISAYLEGDLLEPVPDLRGPGIIAQHDGSIRGKRKARRGPLRTDI